MGLPTPDDNWKGYLEVNIIISDATLLLYVVILVRSATILKLRKIRHYSFLCKFWSDISMPFENKANVVYVSSNSRIFYYMKESWVFKTNGLQKLSMSVCQFSTLKFDIS